MINNQRQRGRTSNVSADASHGTETGNNFIFLCSNLFSKQLKNWIKKRENVKRKRKEKNQREKDRENIRTEPKHLNLYI